MSTEVYNAAAGLVAPPKRFRGWQFRNGAWMAVITADTEEDCRRFGCSMVLPYPEVPGPDRPARSERLHRSVPAAPATTPAADGVAEPEAWSWSAWRRRPGRDWEMVGRSATRRGAARVLADVIAAEPGDGFCAVVRRGDHPAHCPALRYLDGVIIDVGAAARRGGRR